MYQGTALAVPIEAAPDAALAAEGSIDEQRREVDISATLCMSPCSSDYIFSNKLFVGIWHIVSEDSSRIRKHNPRG